MALESHVESKLLSTGSASTTQSHDGYGFTPKILLCMKSARSVLTDSVDGPAIQTLGFGMATGTSERSSTNIVTSDTGGSFGSFMFNTSDSIANNYTNAGTRVGAWDFNGFHSDGWTEIVDDQLGVAYALHSLGLGGDAIAQAKVGSFTKSTSTGTQDVTGPGFRPDAVIFLQGMGIGAAAGPDGQIVNCVTVVVDRDGSSANRFRYSRTGECLAGITHLGGAVNTRGYVSNWISNGFRIQWDEVDGVGSTLHYCAIRSEPGHAWRIGTGTTATNTSEFFVSVPNNFTPQCGIVVSHCSAESSSDTSDVDAEFSIGMFSGEGNGRAVSLRVETSNSTSSHNGSDVNSSYANLTDAGTSLDGEGGVTTLDRGVLGFTMSNADPSGSFFWILAGGESVPPPTGAPIFF